MSKKIKNMLSILFVAVLTVSAFCIPASAAEDDLTISISTDEKDSVTAKVGDTVKYAIYMTDTKEEVIGAAMSFFYNDEYLKLNADSINCESFKNAIGNPKLKNFYTFTWTDVQNPVKLNGDKALVSAEFKVLKGGKTDLSYFISDMSCWIILNTAVISSPVSEKLITKKQNCVILPLSLSCLVPVSVYLNVSDWMWKTLTSVTTVFASYAKAVLRW